MTDNNKKTHLIVTGRGGVDQVQADWNQTDTEQPDYIKNKPELAAVATSGSYNDLTDKPTIPTQVQADWNETDTTDPSYIQNKPTILTQWFGTQAEYDLIDPKDPNVIYNIEGSDNVQADWNQSDSSADDYIKNKPTIPAAQVNSDWNAVSGVAQILNKPSLATVATSGNYSDLNGTPTLATVATSGDYDDLTNKPTIPAAQVNSDWNSNSGVSQILNKPSLATVATSGNYSDLNGTPTLATVATSGDYDDLQNKPTIPAAPVQSDWNEADSSSLAYIANKPTIPAAQVQSDWNQSDNTQADYIKNKPNITPTPPMTTETLTFTLDGGKVKTVQFYTVPNYFYVEDISGSNNTLSITKSSASAPDVEVFYSTDKVNWTNMGTTSTTAITATIPANGKLYLKANANSWALNIITASGNHNVGGNIMSLLYSDNFTNQTSLQSNGIFRALFKNNNKIVNSNNLELPATTMTNSCYTEMFSNCTALTTAPALPATTLANDCYSNMFEYCTSLTTAPALPATTLANACYEAMFRYCSALTTAPALPATTLANLCYGEMFYFCTSLTTAPALPATTPYQSCYESMFEYCTSLTTAPVIKLNTVNISCMGYMFDFCTKLNNVISYITQTNNNYMNNWLKGVSATGDFYNLGGATFQSGTSGIPTGWTVHTSL